MQNFLEKNHRFLMAAVFLLAAILIFTGLTRADVQTDESTYSLRALGWLDYMDTINLQTTPIQWFDSIPSWSKLSFHDAPPLVFAIQNVFFKIFGESVLAIRLPFALAGFLSVILLYLLTKELYGRSTALLSSLSLAVLNYHSWASKVGYLEPIATFFILLTLYLFVLSLKDHKKFIFFGASLGLMMLTKYTSFFVIPVIIVYLLLKNRKVFFSKFFWLSLLIALVIVSPVIFYNIKMFQTRGHFDVQFAKLFNQDIGQDWPGLVKADSHVNYLIQSLETWRLTQVMSLPMYLLFLAGLLYVIFSIFNKENRDKNLLLFLIIIFLSLTFAFIGNTVRFLSILNPFIALTIAVFIVKIMEKLSRLRKHQFYSLVGIVVVVFGVELFYNINTNILVKPIGQVDKHYSVYRFEEGGYGALENYLLANTTIGKSTRHSINIFNDVLLSPSIDLVGKDVVIFDPNLRWFSTLWYFRRFALYNKDLFISAADLALSLPVEQWEEFFKSAGVKDFYYVRGKNDAVFDGGHKNSDNQLAASALEEYLESLGANTTNINNSSDELAFTIYKLNIN